MDRVQFELSACCWGVSLLRGIGGAEISRSIRGMGLMDGFSQTNLYRTEDLFASINHCGAM
jgi:hypothetical protein